ncbi:tol-pal system-associated acyl-CoA thioesterase [Falsihalocynthiibacter sp. SS001]|uniref:tol-pal system-associated acyl-CoA thioesterase n=1 Tax=Falsihalocynthiibacter sp. SS001 TaxID=3349698 RepID=UPI0036D3EDEC
MPHVYPLRVYYEDTDMAGIVYYANYLKFIERARSEYVREIGIDQTALKAEKDVAFAVRRLEADYVEPAQFDDVLTVETSVEAITGARMVMEQVVKRGESVLFTAIVTLVAIRLSDGTPTRLPAEIRRIAR